LKKICNLKNKELIDKEKEIKKEIELL